MSERGLGPDRRPQLGAPAFGAGRAVAKRRRERSGGDSNQAKLAITAPIHSHLGGLVSYTLDNGRT